MTKKIAATKQEMMDHLQHYDMDGVTMADGKVKVQSGGAVANQTRKKIKTTKRK